MLRCTLFAVGIPIAYAAGVRGGTRLEPSEAAHRFVFPWDGAVPLERGPSYLVTSAGADSTSNDARKVDLAAMKEDDYEADKDPEHHHPPYPVDQTIVRPPDANGNMWDEPHWVANGHAAEATTGATAETLAATVVSSSTPVMETAVVTSAPVAFDDAFEVTPEPASALTVVEPSAALGVPAVSGEALAVTAETASTATILRPVATTIAPMVPLMFGTGAPPVAGAATAHLVPTVTVSPKHATQAGVPAVPIATASAAVAVQPQQPLLPSPQPVAAPRDMGEAASKKFASAGSTSPDTLSEAIAGESCIGRC